MSRPARSATMTWDTDERGKLLPCPFCGGEAKLADWSATSRHGAFDVYCANYATRCVTMDGNNTEVEAISAWNTRAPAGHAEPEALREAAFKLSCHDQFRLATFIAENVGYVLAPEPE